METTFFQKNLATHEEEAFNKYIKGKLSQIEGLLMNFSSDAQFLKISIEKFEKHAAYEVEFCLTLPTKSIIAKEASHNITKAVDLTKDRLVSQIKKHLAVLNKSRAHKSIRTVEEVKEKIGLEVFF